MGTSLLDERLATAVAERIASLPPLPSVVSQLLSLDLEQGSYIDDVHRLAAWDPTLAVRLIEYASRTIRISGAADKFQLRHAIARLGTRQIANLVATLALLDAFPAKTRSDRDLWTHSVQVGVLSRWLSVLMPDLGLVPEHAYLTGLLHDIGRFIVFQSVPDGPSRVDESGWADPLTLIAAENAVLGTNHVAIGSEACERWGMPKVVTQVVALHHDFDLPVDTFEQRQMAVCVGVIQIADALSMRLMRELATEEPDAKDPAAEDDDRLAVAMHSELETAFERDLGRLPRKYKAALPSQIPRLLANAREESQRIARGLGIDAGNP
jgi:putative nucleotidyltransferase with HDIG domain